MTIFHRLGIGKDRRREFLPFGLDLRDYEQNLEEYFPFVVVRLSESDDVWKRISHLCETDCVHTIETEFIAEELEAASAVRFLSSWFTGFPHPDDGGYLEITYDLSDYCEKCGIGSKQKAPFRIWKEPKWGRRHTLQLNWVFDEIFVKRETAEAVLKPFGVDCWPVHSRSGKLLEGVVQPNIIEHVDLELDPALPKQVCGVCGRTKWLPLERGYWPHPDGATAGMFKSNQYFGDGAEASQEMFVSHELYTEMVRHKMNCRYWAAS